MKNIYWIGIACFALLSVGCGADFKPGTRIESPRILALQADRPFARPGEEVALTLLSANPADEPLQWAWGTCTLPKSSTVDDCLEVLDAELERFEPEVDALGVRVPSDLLDDLTDAQRPSALIGVVVLACPGELQGGATLGVPMQCVDEDGNVQSIHELEVGIKRVFVRESDRNDNPLIERITWDGETWDEDEVQAADVCEKETFAIDDCNEALQRRIQLDITDREAGRDEFGGDFAEQVIVQFYSTHGLFRDQVRIAEDTDNRWLPQRGVTGDDDIATLWFITRDDRGGVSWTTRHVELR